MTVDPNSHGEAAGGTWVLQAEAADRAGCSVSVIRKWRRGGVVAHRSRVTPGGMRRVEVRLEDVLDRAQQSGLRRRQPPPASPAPAGPAPYAPSAGARMSVVPLTELDAFVERIAEAERRAAVAEASLLANEALTQFLRDRVNDLQRHLQAAQAAQDVEAAPAAAAAPNHLQRVALEIRALRSRVAALREGETPHSAQQLAKAKVAYDTALISASLALGLPTPFRLGDTLAAGERTKLTRALEEAGLHLLP